MRAAPKLNDGDVKWTGAATDGIGLAALLVAVTLLTSRLYRSLDLTDEAYYAIFIDDWLKGSIHTSTLSTLHETAALIVYPFAIVYHSINGGNDGLLLFLRQFYLAAAFGMAAAWWRFSRTTSSRELAWPMAIAAIGFIPFGLPAPSYNTLGMQGVLVALSALGVAQGVPKGQSRWRLSWLITSAAAAAMASVAYPPLVAFVAVLALLSLFLRGAEHLERVKYIIALACSFGFGWALIIAALSWDGLVQSFVNVANLNNSGDVWRKIVFTFEVLRWQKAFTFTLVVAGLLGVFRPWIPFWAAATVMLGVTAGCFLHSPTLFVRSHDVVTTLSATGLWLLAGFRRSASREERMIAVLYATSLAAGAITGASATWSPFNFCIGAFPAMLLAIAFNLQPGGSKGILVGAALAGVMLWLGFSEHFHTSKDAPQATIKWGFFSGISAPLPMIAQLEFVRDHVSPFTEPDRTILVLGRMPGLGLATSARPMTIWAWPLAPDVSPRAPEYIRQFYSQNSGHRPRAILIYKDPIMDPVNPLGTLFGEWYREVDRKEIEDSQLTVFERK